MIKRYINNFIIVSNKLNNRYYSSTSNGNIKYSKNHTWISIPKELNNENNFEISVPGDQDGSDGNGGTVVTFGLTEEFINFNTKYDDILYIKFPLIDNNCILINKECITIETMSDHFKINSPLSGKVIEINQDLLDYPNDLNINPNKNWLAKLSIQSGGSNSELNQLMNKEEYEKYCENNLIK